MGWDTAMEVSQMGRKLDMIMGPITESLLEGDIGMHKNSLVFCILWMVA